MKANSIFKKKWQERRERKNKKIKPKNALKESERKLPTITKTQK